MVLSPLPPYNHRQRNLADAEPDYRSLFHPCAKYSSPRLHTCHMAPRTDKVDYWENSNQRQRWVATALLDIEPGLRRIRGIAICRRCVTRSRWR